MSDGGYGHMRLCVDCCVVYLVGHYWSILHVLMMDQVAS